MKCIFISQSSTIDSSFLQFMYADKFLKSNLSLYDMSDLEDFFDYAYLSNAEPEEIAISIAEDITRARKSKKKFPSGEKLKNLVIEEAISRANFVIDNSSIQNKYKKHLKTLAESWSELVSDHVIKTIPYYT